MLHAIWLHWESNGSHGTVLHGRLPPPPTEGHYPRWMEELLHHHVLILLFFFLLLLLLSIVIISAFRLISNVNCQFFVSVTLIITLIDDRSIPHNIIDLNFSYFLFSSCHFLLFIRTAKPPGYTSLPRSFFTAGRQTPWETSAVFIFFLISIVAGIFNLLFFDIVLLFAFSR